MANPQKQKGSKAEIIARDYLVTRGVPCERIPAGANLDRADLWVPIIEWPTIDVKAFQTPRLPEWLDYAAVQAANAGRMSGAVLHKRYRSSDPANWFLTFTVSGFCDHMEQFR